MKPSELHEALQAMSANVYLCTSGSPAGDKTSSDLHVQQNGTETLAMGVESQRPGYRLGG